ncbi:FAD-dependent oxidoreductase [Salinisphaera sp. G21_0]|uniref:FAD-dependent oxidoreductase n=1 Tax=Salinisphaera sp. G21_0 TaxID=2821094 RepID=UPI001ADC0F06|nr:FAD-dependent oxidoreductase [Salinisphaera sp. G21_0]MBO9482904.1 FAD-dependent oxidoreductase [Salinisphaera sp. G21_0]
MNTYDVVIIGSGLAGLTLVKEIRKLDKDKSILVVTSDQGESYSKPMLSNSFSKGKLPAQLVMATAQALEKQFNIRVFNQTRVDSIDPNAQRITVNDQYIDYHQLVLATGAECRQLPIKGKDIEEVVSINDLEDYRRFRSLAENKRRILIMGAGLIGCEFADDLIGSDHEVHIVDPSETALSGLIPEIAGNALVKGLEESGVKFHFGTSVNEIIKKSDGICAVLNNGLELDTDVVISAVGLQPNTSLAESADISCNRGIVVNSFLETQINNIYALGDCAEIDGKVMLYVMPLMKSARALAKTVTGKRTEVQFDAMPIATKTPSCPIVVLPPQENEGNWVFQCNGKDVLGLYKKNDELKGFVLTNRHADLKNTLLKKLDPETPKRNPAMDLSRITPG